MVGSLGRLGGLRGAAALLTLLLTVGCDSGIDETADDDVVPPSIVSTTPVADAEVGGDVRITVVFDEDMDPVSVSDGVTLIGIAGVAGYDGSTFTAEFVPTESLPLGGHTLSIRGVRDLAGNALGSVTTVSFTVR